MADPARRTRRGLTVLALAALTVGCRADPSPAWPSVEVEVSYATTRERTGASDPRRFYGPRVGGLERGRVTVRLPHDPRLGARETGPPVRRSSLEAVEPGEAMPAGDEVLVYVPGLDVSFEAAARRAARLAYELDFEGRLAFFAWPSAGTYGGDEVRSLRAADVLAPWLAALAAERRVHVLTRSLGARAVAGALRALAREEAPPRLGEVMFVAPDIGVDEFTETIAPEIAPVAERITVYVSANDRVLHYDIDAEALGDTDNGVPLGEQFVTVDASAVDTGLLGHDYGDERRSVLTDIAALLAGEESGQRLPQRVGRTTYWTLEGPPIGAPE